MSNTTKTEMVAEMKSGNRQERQCRRRKKLKVKESELYNKRKNDNKEENQIMQRGPISDKNEERE